MTTIAYRDGTLAGDSATADGIMRDGDVRKVGVVQGWLVGFAGSAALIDYAMEALDDVLEPDKRPPALLLDLSEIADGTDDDENADDLALLLANGKRLFMAQMTKRGVIMCVELRSEFAAIGSGAAFAIGAMEAGSSARDAVEIAALYDLATGGEVVAVHAG